MNRGRMRHSAIILLGAIVVMLAAPDPGVRAADDKTSVSEAMSHDGLQQVKSKSLDLLYLLPGTTLAAYEQVWIDPVQIAFHKSWNPDRRTVDASDRERIRSELASEFQRVFTEELQEKGGYQIATAPGPTVLRVTPAIINLYINAPDAMQAGRGRTYTVSSGEMTLMAELRDSESGAILARAVDRRTGSTTGQLQWTTRTNNLQDARRALRVWADTLRKALDSARAAKT